MKTVMLTFTILLLSSLELFAQSGMTIQSGGTVTVQGNLSISECPPPETPTLGHIHSQTQIIWNWNSVYDAIGYKWNTTNDYNSATNLGTSTTKTETGLICNTTYSRYIWAYNACGYSLPMTLIQTTSGCSIICGQLITDTRDGKTYNTVLIGSQCWMKQNLNIGTKILNSADQTNNTIIEKYCYNDDENNCNTYGGLYQWDEVMQYTTVEGMQGICPSGWHLPTDAEWTTLMTILGGESIAGGKMKEAGITHWASPNTGANNSSGFTGLPGGIRNNSGSFGGLTNYTYFWSSSQSDATGAWSRNLHYLYREMYGGSAYKNEGFSVRCLND